MNNWDFLIIMVCILGLFVAGFLAYSYYMLSAFGDTDSSRKDWGGNNFYSLYTCKRYIDENGTETTNRPNVGNYTRMYCNHSA